ncbi:hypothetical protein HELRODRAFT_163467 [Helobdella robusta]|uniref:HTH psq-type domain-containing protein n=1 Tax=Helobdella robusta TaxID=6412 RepID=T1EU34_HELRO|nr:hypothetical protein HELRODRAFT_163467 [Helobdella robusta]ESN96406.1 hypothetical protein HELRODRAFT_163467 [Helobdella robusta]
MCKDMSEAYFIIYFDFQSQLIDEISPLQCAPCHGGSLICTSKGFGFIMVRYRERKTNRGKTPVEVMRTAVDEVLKKNRAINAVARETGIDRMTLKRYVRKSSLSPSVGLIPNWNTRQVFNLEQEEMLAKYLLQASKMNYGLSTKTTRQFAYDMAVANNITCPSSWSMKKTAEVLKPFPKASARKKLFRNRQQKTRILTDTPVKHEIFLAKEKSVNKKKRTSDTVKKTKAMSSVDYLGTLESDDSDGDASNPQLTAEGPRSMYPMGGIMVPRIWGALILCRGLYQS